MGDFSLLTNLFNDACEWLNDDGIEYLSKPCEVKYKPFSLFASIGALFIISTTSFEDIPLTMTLIVKEKMEVLEEVNESDLLSLRDDIPIENAYHLEIDGTQDLP